MALEDTTCVLVPRRAALALFEQNSTVAARLYLGLCESLEASITRIAELSGRVEVRLAQLFLRLARTAGRPQGRATFIPIRLSRQELADSVGTTIETCIRLMSRWDKQCFVFTKHDGFLVSDLKSLERVARAEATQPHSNGNHKTTSA